MWIIGIALQVLVWNSDSDSPNFIFVFRGDCAWEKYYLLPQTRLLDHSKVIDL